MKRGVPQTMVGNEFVLPQTANLPLGKPAVAASVVVTPVPSLEDIAFEFEAVGQGGHWSSLLSWLHRYSVGTFAILLCLVSVSAIYVGANYYSKRIPLSDPNITVRRIPAKPLSGPNMVVATPQLNEALSAITAQPINVALGDQSVAVGPDKIRQWLQIVADKKTGATYIHVDKNAITKSLSEVTAPFVKTPVDQVTVTRTNGSSRIIATGRNGTKLGDMTPAAEQITQGLLASKGLQLNVPLETVAFASVTPANFDKLIEIDLSAKQMWTYEKGQMVRHFLVSAGAPETPTAVGQFKIKSKLRQQDMRGFNANGTRYFQPDVKWVNYFHKDYGIHGNYWRPRSWFGAINSSHGCVSVPDDEAKWIYAWAPVGTTVITHH